MNATLTLNIGQGSCDGTGRAEQQEMTWGVCLPILSAVTETGVLQSRCSASKGYMTVAITRTFKQQQRSAWHWLDKVRS